MVKIKTLLITIAYLLIFEMQGMKEKEALEITSNNFSQQFIAQRKQEHLQDLRKKTSLLDAYINRIIRASHKNSLEFPDYETPTIFYSVPMEIGSNFFKSIHSPISNNAPFTKEHNPNHLPNLAPDTLSEETTISHKNFLETFDNPEHQLCILQNGLSEADKLSLQKKRCLFLSKIMHFNEIEKKELCTQMKKDSQQFTALATPLGIFEHEKFLNHFDKIVSLREGLKTSNAVLINSCFKDTTIKNVTIIDYIATCIIQCKQLIEERDKELYLGFK